MTTTANTMTGSTGGCDLKLLGDIQRFVLLIFFSFYFPLHFLWFFVLQERPSEGLAFSDVASSWGMCRFTQ